MSPTSELTVTEASPHELLTYITLSLAGLDLFTDNVTVNATEYLSTYDFSRPLSCLTINSFLADGAPIVALGLWSMRQNGVPATNGFLQVMMATRGRSEMERLVLEQELVDLDKASEGCRSCK